MTEKWDREKIREAFIYDGGIAEFYDPIGGARENARAMGAIFDRWYAAEKAKWQSEALRDAAHAMRSHKDAGHWNLRDEEFPADAAQSPDCWLEKRADRIERREQE